MHPIERLRYVARSGEADARMLVGESAAALRAFHFEPAGLVVACRRIVERHPTCGPLWSMSARLLTAADPFAVLSDVADDVIHDPTPSALALDLPDEATVCVVGWPDLAADALIRRGDVALRVIDAFGEGASLVRRLDRDTELDRDTVLDLDDGSGVDADVTLVSPEELGSAVAGSDLVLIEALAAGPGDMLARAGSLAAVAVARVTGAQVWAVVGRGRSLPMPLWDGMLGRIDDEDVRGVDRVPFGLVDAVAGPAGVVEVAGPGGAPEADCPHAPELLRRSAI